MNEWTKERILVLVKTYPSPSRKYQELVCVAGVNESLRWRRLYPVPFRSLPQYQQFKKYSWVNVDCNHVSINGTRGPKVAPPMWIVSKSVNGLTLSMNGWNEGVSWSTLRFAPSRSFNVEVTKT